MVALPASLSARSFPFTPACPGQYTHRSFRKWMSTTDTFQSGLHIPLFTFCSTLTESVRMMTCRLLRQSSGGHRWLLPPPLSRWRLRQYRLHCLHGQLSPLAWSPTLTGLWWLSHQCTLWGLAVCCFLKREAWSLTLFCLLAILDSASPCFLAGVSYRDAGSGLGPFPALWFAWALSAGILAVVNPLFDPSKTSPSQSASPCVFHGFVEWVVRISDGTEICFDLLHFLSVLIPFVSVRRCWIIRLRKTDKWSKETANQMKRCSSLATACTSTSSGGWSNQDTLVKWRRKYFKEFIHKSTKHLKRMTLEGKPAVMAGWAILGREA